jgi:hypothetical protein
MLLLGTGAVAVAMVATLFPPPVSVWLPAAGIVAAVGLLAGFAQWVLAQIQGGSNPSSSLNPSQVLELVKKRRSVFPKDMTGGWWGQAFMSSTWSSDVLHEASIVEQCSWLHHGISIVCTPVGSSCSTWYMHSDVALSLHALVLCCLAAA